MTISKSHMERALDILGCIVLNARLQPDAAMGGTTDCYAVPLDDVDAARALLDEIFAHN